MSQQSEERLPESTPADPSNPQGARILHMKSTQYDLQRAIQQRAQESVEREASLDREERRPKPVKWLIIFVIACLPIALTLFMVDGFLRAFHQYLSTTSKQQTQQAEQSATPETTLQSSEPGVVLLQPMNIPEPAPAPAEPGATDSSNTDSTAAPRN
jgi:hypothetical protein